MKKLSYLAVLLLFTLGAVAQDLTTERSGVSVIDLSKPQPALIQVQQQFDLATSAVPEVPVTAQLAALQQITAQLQRIQDPRKAAAEAVALRSGMPIRTTMPDGRVAEVMRLSPTGMPMYYITDNLNAAATTSVDKVWPLGSAGLSLAGAGMLLGEWDGGAVRLTHQEFPSAAVTQVDGSTTPSDHATHVAGTMVARGIQANAKGMAYQATLAAYDWTNDETEMMAAGANGMLVSNHSYGLITGFAWGNWSGTTGWHWMSEPGDTEDRNFGRYSDQAQAWDAIANNRPNYLIVKAAGNDRGDGPTPGASYFHQIWNGSAWVWQATTMARQLDGGPTGYDCISHAGVSKNVLTVGAVNGIAGGYSNASQVVMSSFSGWGPTDDGRIKPDIVGKGVGVYSPITGTNNSGYDTYNGTSMASPNVSGGLILLQQHYKNLNSNQTMNASTLKALVLHTADEAGLHPGPDYVHGWGLMNVKKATDVIGNVGGKHAMVATNLSNSQTYTYQVNSNGTEPLRATIVWNDPAGVVPAYVLNGTTPALVRDLDVRIIRNSDNTIFSPWILNPANRAAAATTGDNVRDNVEQVLLANPVAGGYTVRVTHKGTLSTPQAFSLIVSGVAATTTQVTFRVDMTGQTVSQGVRIMGSFQGFSPSTTSMAQVGSTQIYSYTATLNIGDTIQYRFVNGNTLGQAETVASGCRYLATANRWVVVGSSPITLPAYLFGQCTAATIVPPQFVSAPAGGTGTTAARGPNGTADHNFMRGALHITASDFSTVGVLNGRQITAIGMAYNTPGNAPVTGNLKLYFLNTTQTTYSRGATYSSIISGMTLVYDSVLTLPTTGIGWAVNLQTPVTYTGNAVYLAYEWTTTGTAASTAISYRANTGIANSCYTANSLTAAPTTLAATNFRPEIRWGLQRISSDLEVLALFGLGRNPKVLGAGERFQALVRNNGTTNVTNAAISLAMTGQNTLNAVKNVNIDVDSTVLVEFDPFNAAQNGISSLSVSVPSDGANGNNSKSWTQEITDTIFSRSYGNTGNNSVGFNTGSGLLLTKFKVNGQSTVRAARIFISNHVGNVGNTVSAVVTSPTGSILATSAGLTLTTAHYNTWQTFNFTTPVPVANQEFMIGLRQPANTVGYFPIGVQTESFSPANAYFTATLTGTNVSPLNGFRLMMEAHMSGPVVQNTTNVTFQVDMTGRQVSGNGVHIAGSFQGWNPATTPMIRVGTSQIYTYTAALPIGDTIEYKFVNGRNWGGYDSINNVPVDSSEFVPVSCARPGTVNRFVIVPAQSLILPVFRFSSCSSNSLLLNETFAAGIPANWTNTGTANGVSNPNAVFEYRGPATTPNNTVGSRGAFNNGRGPLQSPTVNNGFVIFDSDWRDNNGISTGAGTGTAPGQHLVSLTTAAFNTQGIGALTLKFNQTYRRFGGPGGLQVQPATFLVFSKDNGVSWPDTVMINANVAVNAVPDSTSTIRLSVGQYLGNSPAAKIQFLFNGSYYFWMLDDISVGGTAAHDLTIMRATTFRNGQPDFYGMIPLSQRDSIRFGADAFNAGADPQAGVGLRAEVFRNGQSIWTEFNSQAGNVLQPGDTSFVVVNQPPFYPSQAGSYRVALDVTNFQADSNPANNRDTLTFAITDTTMALDNGGFAAGAIGTNSFVAGNEDGMRVANLYQLRQNAEISSATVRFAPNSVPGATVQFHLIPAVNLAGGIPVLSSDFRTVTAADIANGLTLSFVGTPSQRTLPAGAFYLAIELYSNGGANHIRVLDQINIPVTPQAAVTYLPSFNQWYDNGNAFLLRLNTRLPVVNCNTSITAPGMNANNQVTVCSGSSITLTAPQDATASFQWFRDGNPINWSINHELQVFVSGMYHHTKTVGACIVNSDTAHVSVIQPPLSTIGVSGPSFYPAGSTIGTVLTAGPQLSLRIGTQLPGGGIHLTYYRADSLNGWFAQLPGAAFAGDMVVARSVLGDSLGCTALANAAQMNGKIAVIYRGSCEFGTKALNAQQAGATAVIIINNVENNLPPLMGSGAVGAQVTIPVVSVSLESGQIIRQLLNAGVSNAVFGQFLNLNASYQWYRNNFPIMGATNYSYPANQAGSYTLVVNPGNACASESEAVNIRQSIFQQTPWQVQNLNQPSVNLTVAAVHAVDSQVAWSLSEMPAGLTFPVTFFRTTNGGTSWTSGGIPGTIGLGTSSIVATDANMAWVTLYGDSARQGVYHTSNGGITWTRQATAYNNNGFPNVTRFFNANVGVSLGDMAGGFIEIYTTTNGGQQWNRVPIANLPNWTDPQTAGMVDEATIVGNYIYYPLNNGNYMYSRNQGQSWTQVFTQVSGQMQLAAADTNTIVIRGDQGLRFTTNGGQIWNEILTNPGVGFINAMKFIPGTAVPTLMVSGNLGTSYTTDFFNWIFIDSVYHKELSFVSPRHGWSGGVSITGNQRGMYRWNSTHFLNTTPPIGNTARIYGRVRYDNSSFTDLSNALVTIRRTPTMELVDTVRANGLGQYLSSPLAPGSYSVTASTAKAWGGANATDALLISRHFANLDPLGGLRLAVADVNASMQVNNTDALLVSQRFIGAIPTFAAGNWHFTTMNFNLNAGDSSMMNISSLCYGDVNASYVPQGNAREINQVLLQQQEPVQLSTSQYTDLLVQVQQAYTIGALSLVFQLPVGVQFEEVSLVPPHAQNLTYQLNGQELRISWFSLQPLSLQAGAPLLKLRFLAGTLPAAQHGISISSASEIADAQGLPIAGATLLIPQLVGIEEAGLNNRLVVLAYPNPFGSSTQLRFDLPEAGELDIEIRDLSGRLVQSQALGRQAAGRHEIVLEREQLRSGLYFATVKLQSTDNSYVRILRLIAE